MIKKGADLRPKGQTIDINYIQLMTHTKVWNVFYPFSKDHFNLRVKHFLLGPPFYILMARDCHAYLIKGSIHQPNKLFVSGQIDPKIPAKKQAWEIIVMKLEGSV